MKKSIKMELGQMHIGYVNVIVATQKLKVLQDIS